MPLSEQIAFIVESSGLLQMYKNDPTDRDLSRYDNIKELVGASKSYPQTNSEKQIKPFVQMHDFLTNIALLNHDESEEGFRGIQLMTLHAAKGLEFPLVFLTGCEEGLFPHRMSMHEQKGLEEERRLCYVGMTRAMQRLVISYSEVRRVNGNENYNRPSRFIYEMPQECMQEIRLSNKRSYASKYGNSYNNQNRETHNSNSYSNTRISNTEQTNAKWRLGQRVTHKVFGEGLVLNYEEAGEDSRVQIHFKDHGNKWLLTSIAPLESLD